MPLTGYLHNSWKDKVITRSTFVYAISTYRSRTEGHRKFKSSENVACGASWRSALNTAMSRERLRVLVTSRARRLFGSAADKLMRKRQLLLPGQPARRHSSSSLDAAMRQSLHVGWPLGRLDCEQFRLAVHCTGHHAPADVPVRKAILGREKPLTSILRVPKLYITLHNDFKMV